MPEKHVYEYAVIRIVPKVERQEFLNAGIIMFCKKQQYIRMQYHLDRERLKAFSSDTDADDIECNLESFEKISRGEKDGLAIAAQDPAERFRWLTAVRSSCIQTSQTHPGMTEDLDATFNALFHELVK